MWGRFATEGNGGCHRLQEPDIACRPTLSRTVKSLKGIRNPGNAVSERAEFFLCKKPITVHKLPAAFPPFCPQNGARLALRQRLRRRNEARRAEPFRVGTSVCLHRSIGID
jgi:hypothetical protein